MRRQGLVWSVLCAGLFLLGGCGSIGQVGEGCQGGVGVDDCTEGAICTLAPNDSVEPDTTPNNETFFCRQLCDTEVECPDAAEQCQRVPGSNLSSCQPRPVEGATGG